MSSGRLEMYSQLNRLNSLITNPQGPFANRQRSRPHRRGDLVCGAQASPCFCSQVDAGVGWSRAHHSSSLGTVLTLSRKRGLGDAVLTCGHPRLPCPNPLLATLKGSHPGDLPGLVAATVPETVRGNVPHSSVGEDSETDSLFGSWIHPLPAL